MNLPFTEILGGLTPAQETCSLVNRTGATLNAGDLVSVNLDFAATAGQAMVGIDPSINADGATGYVLGAAIAMTTANAIYILSVALGTIADNAIGRFGHKGIFDVKMNGANPGEFIVGTNAQVYGTPYTLAELQALTTGIANVVGICLETTSGVQAKKCIFDGEAWRSCFTGDT